MKRFCRVLALLAVLLAPVLAWADTKTHAEAGVELWLPDDWTATMEGDLLTASAESSDVAISFIVIDGEGLEAATAALDEKLASYVADATPKGEAQASTINGMDAVLVEGSGTMDGTPVEFGVAVIVCPKGKLLMVLGLGSAEGVKTHDETLTKIMTSIKPAQ